MGCGESKLAVATTEQPVSFSKRWASFSRRSSKKLDTKIETLENTNEDEQQQYTESSPEFSAQNETTESSGDEDVNENAYEEVVTPRAEKENNILVALASFGRMRQLVLQKIETEEVQ